MAIGSAIESGSVILVYDQRGQMLFTKPKGSGPNDGLLGFTGSTVTVRSGSTTFTYGEYGQLIYTKAASCACHGRCPLSQAPKPVGPQGSHATGSCSIIHVLPNSTSCRTRRPGPKTFFSKLPTVLTMMKHVKRIKYVGWLW